MREIKFREWDKHREEMYGKGHGMSYGEREDFDDMVGWRFAHEENFGEEPRVLMQFTGLKDKNGRDIYEWDILRVQKSISDETKFNVLVKWLVSGFCLACPYAENTIQMEYVPWYVNQSAEVIGNRYETPDLLKEG